MASIISANIDLTKIEKGKIYEGKKGKYYPVTIVLNDEPGQYGDSGYIQTEQTNGELESQIDIEKKQFILTSSQNYLLLESISQSLAGRISLLNLYPLTHAETVQKNQTLFFQL